MSEYAILINQLTNLEKLLKSEIYFNAQKEISCVYQICYFLLNTKKLDKLT